MISSFAFERQSSELHWEIPILQVFSFRHPEARTSRGRIRNIITGNRFIQQGIFKGIMCAKLDKSSMKKVALDGKNSAMQKFSHLLQGLL